MEVADFRSVQLDAEYAVVADLLKGCLEFLEIDGTVAESTEGGHLVAAFCRS